ncbi:CPBP family intramembrane glutamic endopeptidase [Sphingomonas sp.]|uniref:CPBP family intramembrane glutamic endopeptidase n=1 Tax=Sphingomonas sp. TaxID=28214 RepID=UPI003AFF68DF
MRWLRALGWMVGLFLGLGVLFGLAVGGLSFVVRAARGGPMTIATGWIGVGVMAVSLAIVVAAYLLAVRLGEDRRASEFAAARLLPEWLAGLGVGGVLMAVSVGVMAFAGFVTVRPVPASAIASAITNTIQSGILEELLFRLVVFRLLWRAAGPWWALALSALLFGGLHLTNPNASPFAAVCIAFEAGILLGAFYMLTGRIWASIGVHMGWNFTQGWIFGAAVSGTDGFAGGPLTTTPKAAVADWLDGGRFGPEAALPALLICTAAGLWVLRRAWLAGQFGERSPAG